MEEYQEVKNQKNLFIITSVVTIISFFGYCIGKNCRANMISDISLAVFGSALLGAIMSLTSYMEIKEAVVHSALYSVDKHVDLLSRVEPMQIQIPKVLLEKLLDNGHLIAEEKLYQQLEQEHFIKRGTKRSLSVWGLYLEWIKQTTFTDYTESDIEKTAEERKSDAISVIRETADKYRKLPNLSFEQVENRLKELSFFNKKKQKEVQDIISELRKWTMDLNKQTGNLLNLSNLGCNDFMLYNFLNKTEEKFFSFGEWKNYEYEDENAMFTYRQRSIKSKYYTKIEKLEDDLLNIKPDKTDTNCYLQWKEYVIAPIVGKNDSI